MSKTEVQNLRKEQLRNGLGKVLNEHIWECDWHDYVGNGYDPFWQVTDPKELLEGLIKFIENRDEEVKKRERRRVYKYMDNWVDSNIHDLGELGKFIRIEYVKNGMKECEIQLPARDKMDKERLEDDKKN